MQFYKAFRLRGPLDVAPNALPFRFLPPFPILPTTPFYPRDLSSLSVRPHLTSSPFPNLIHGL